MLVKLKPQDGFTIIEVAIVLLVVAFILGYTVALFPIQQELKQYRATEDEMDNIIDELLGYAQVNGRLPCPDTGTDGLEDTVDVLNNVTGAGVGDGIVDGCAGYFGFLPSATLGMEGDINATGQLQDPWGSVYGYAVSNINADADVNPLTAAAIDLVSPNGIRDEGITAYSLLTAPPGTPPDLFVCDDSNTVGNDLTCGDVTGNLVAGNVAVVIVSLGKNFDLVVSSNIQRENFDDFNVGTNDKVYVSATRSDAANAEFDDVVKWISPNRLFSKMIEADQLP